MDIEISLASSSEKNVLRNLMQHYLYEFSTLDGVDVDNDSGMFSYPLLDRYWIDADRYPFFLRVNSNLAGFALVRRGSYFSDQRNQSGKSMTIAEFFVMLKYRRQGIGTRLATNLFDRFPDQWEVAQIANNHAGQAFWRSVIGEYCRGNYEEFVLDNEVWNGLVQVLDNTTLPQE